MNANRRGQMSPSAARGGSTSLWATEAFTLVFAHGVGMWPRLFDPVQDLIDRPHHLWIRPGYGGQPAVETFGEQLIALNEVVNERAPAVVVGVSGGATLALACAISGAPGLAGVITHEPLVGALEPELDQTIQSTAEALHDDPSREASIEFLARLYGDSSWRSLPGFARAWADDHHEVVCREVAVFASFRPTLAGLGRIRVPHHTTVGSRSPAPRTRAADVLESAGASRGVIDGAGHLGHVDNPVAFAAEVERFMSGRLGRAT